MPMYDASRVEKFEVRTDCEHCKLVWKAAGSAGHEKCMYRQLDVAIIQCSLCHNYRKAVDQLVEWCRLDLYWIAPLLAA
jgi:hypothetical protein